MPAQAGQMLSHYRLIEKIGEGGMGVVWKAEDTVLGRQVAIKVLPPELTADPERRLRFQREAQTAAALDHPNIATIHEVGEHDGSQFIVMQLVEGKTLREVISQRPLPLKEWLKLTLPIAEGLAHAHARRVVHRDLKPDNVMITDEQQVKILDFGLAKLLEPEPVGGDAAGDIRSRLETISQELTRAGKVFGTVAYMSPEQARGETVDHRSDLFSFGTLLYHTATGRLPFEGKSQVETLHAVIAEEPPPLSEVAKEFPPEAERIVRKAMDKDPNDRYQHADELSVDLRKLKRDTDSGVQTIAAARATSRRWVAWLAAALLVLVGGVFAYRHFVPTSLPLSHDSLAVMYFENLADRADSDNVGRMLTSLLVTELSNQESLQVVSSQRLFDIAKQLGRGEESTVDRSVATEVAKRAGAGTMVLGQVSRVGDQLVVTTELVNVTNGRLLGSQKAVGHKVEDIFTIAEALGEQVRRDMRQPAPGEGERGRLAQQLTSSVDAYRTYVRGEVFYQRAEFEEAAAEFLEAVRMDPDFALPYHRLATIGLWSDLDETVVRDAAERAVALAEKLPETYRQIAKATALAIHGRLSEAIPLYEAALEKDPRSVDALYLLGESYSHSVRDYDPAKAVAAFERSVSVDPDYTMSYPCLTLGQHYLGRTEEAMVLLERLETKKPRMAQDLRAIMIALQGGPPEEALRLTHAATSVMVLFRPAYAMLASDWELARELVSREPGKGSLRSWVHRNLGDFHVYRGHFAQAIDAYREGGAATSYEPHLGFKGGLTASSLHSLAELLALKGDLAAARTEAGHALAVQPDCPLSRYYVGLFALRDGDASTARAQLEATTEDLNSGRVKWGAIYRDALEAEMMLAEGKLEQAQALFERIVGADKMLFDYALRVSSAGPSIRDGLVRTYLVTGQAEKAAEAVGELLNSGLERINHPVLYVQALYTLGVIELEAGDTVEGNNHLEEFLDHWGNADWDLPQVRDAKARLAAQESR